MKRVLVLIIVLLVITGCNKKEEEIEIIKSTGELLCVYKESRVNENTMYTSEYIYNFDSTGVLINVVNKEKIEFQKDDKEVKEKYNQAMKTAKDDYKDIKGVTANIEKEDNKYTLTINIDKNELDEKKSEDYIVNYDRIKTYKLYTKMGYTCE